METSIENKRKRAALIAKEWENNPYFELSNFEHVSRCVFEYLDNSAIVDNTDAISELSEMVLAIDRIVAKRDETLLQLIDIPDCRTWNDWFLQDKILPSSSTRSFFCRLFHSEIKSIPYSQERRDSRKKGGQDKEIGLLFYDIPFPSLESSLRGHYRNKKIHDLTDEEYNFVFHLTCLVYLYLAFIKIASGVTLSNRIQNRYLRDSVKAYYTQVLNGAYYGSFLEYLNVINDSLSLRELEIISLEDRISSLEKQAKKDLAKTRMEERSKNYQFLKESYESILGKCQHIFSYDLSLYKPEKDIFLFNSGKIIIYGKFYDLSNMTRYEIVSESSVELSFLGEKVVIDCRTPENLNEFISSALKSEARDNHLI